MDTITRALRRARHEGGAVQASARLSESVEFPKLYPGSLETLPATRVSLPPIFLSPSELESHRIVAFSPTIPEARHYDLLRSQVAGSTKAGAVQRKIAVTAPTVGCGATVTCLNVAFSFARMQSVRVLVVDACLARSSMMRYLGLDDEPVTSSTHFDVKVNDVVVHVLRLGAKSLEGRGANPMDEIAQVMREVEANVAVIDTPPMLVADVAIPIVLQADAVALVLAAQQSRVSDLRACRAYLGSKQGVQVVLTRNGRHGL